MSETQARLDGAVRFAREAGQSTLGLFRAGAVEVERKADGSEVTAADRGAEQLLRDRIGAAFPHDAILGEEFGESPGTSGYRWLLDPIDGTTSFVHRVPLYGTLVAVEAGGRAVAGAVYLPGLDEMVYAGAGGGAWHVTAGGEPRRAHVSRSPSLAGAMVLATSGDYFRKAGMPGAWEAVAARAGATRGWSDCYAHVLVATGRAEAVVEPRLSPWDIAPMQVIIEEAGGRCTDWAGRATMHAPQALTSNGLVHDELLAILRTWAHEAG